MKRLILSALLTLYTTVLRVLRIVGLRRGQNGSVLILPPAALGSLGDEAMVAASIEYLRDKQDVRHVGLVAYGTVRDWENFGPIPGVELRHHAFRGFWKAMFRFASVVTRYDRFYCLGADVLDGYYSENSTLQRLSLVSLAAKTGVKTSVLGFSFNEKPAPAAIEALRKLPKDVRLCARDPVSHGRLVHHLQRPVDLVADLAFLLCPDEKSTASSAVLQWIGEQRAKGQTIIGVNANYKLVQNLETQELDRLTQVYVDTLVELHSKNAQFSFVLIPHDFRHIEGEVNDIELAQAIMSALPADMQPYCSQMPTPCSAAEIKGVCGSLDLVISGRMHLAIACLGQGIPAACITYQGKFEGLFRHFELDGMLIEPEKAVQPETLVQFVMPLIEQIESLREHVRSKLPKVQKLSQTNFV